MTCFLCTQCTEGTAGNIDFDSKEAQLLNVRCIIEKHFWRLRTADGIGDMHCICAMCWEQLSSFHSFYLSVEQAHMALTISDIKTTPTVTVLPVEAILGKGTAAAYSEDTKGNCTEIETVVATVKRRRGRPPKAKPKPPTPTPMPLPTVPDTETTDDAVCDNGSDLKAVLEQINLNEIKIEFPEADLTMADVLEDQQEEDDEHDVSDYAPPSACDSEDEKPTRKKPRKTAKSYKGKPKGAGIHNIQKSQEFNEYIKEHYKVHCHVCSTPMEDFSEMLVHARQEHKTRGYALCCGRKFWKRGVLVDHLRRHQDPELFKCHICERVMGQRRSLELHLRMHDIKKRGRLLKCEQCGKSFFSSVVFERHKLTHIPKEQWQATCSTCEKTFPNEYTMQQHVKLVHLNMYAKICDVCGKSIRGREALARHMEEHTGAPSKPIKCHLCGSALTTKYGLARHIKMMHTAENLEPRQCEICFKISPTLQAHLHHMKYTHNTARTHQCPMCEKAFKRPNELREHLTTHTGEVLYTCPHCPKTFNSNANMHAHRKKVHRKEWEEKRRHHPRKSDSTISLSAHKTPTTTGGNETTQLLQLQDVDVD
ncbi:transcription factor grauzone [Scaptodrosophila lebanonensis]|uniref:Transcription factor grauzone n=1 Tax=Drosophila lebanonensis TaxID=7225 RepID=A0A6J2U8P4_DROLE|nr:transcription factor grauzone [Scaptodrosophila lebanonensis]